MSKYHDVFVHSSHGWDLWLVCSLLVTISRAILNRVPVSLKLTGFIDFVNISTAASSSVIHAVMDPTAHCFCRACWH